MNFNKIGFIGLGLIGGSIAKAIKKFYPSTEMIALATKQLTVRAAYNDGVITNSTLIDIKDFKDCDVIFLCCPVKFNIEYMQQLKGIIKDDCILTDVGSVKGDITVAANKLGLKDKFIGGHPMTGSEHTGYEYSTENLLENSYYILTCDSTFDQDNFNAFRSFIDGLGPITLTLDDTAHDFCTAAISHVPHIIAAALCNTVHNNDINDTAKTIAAGGFKDITRIASSSPVMWEHICMTNRDAILNVLASFKAELEAFEETVINGDGATFNRLFSDAKNYRDSITVSGKKSINMIHELYTYIEDKQGTILPVLSLLNDAQISIKNMDIVHNREFEPGVLRLEFYKDEDLRAAGKVLEDNNYEVHYRN